MSLNNVKLHSPSECPGDGTCGTGAVKCECKGDGVVMVCLFQVIVWLYWVSAGGDQIKITHTNK